MNGFRHDASKDFDHALVAVLRAYLASIDEAAGMLRHLIEIGSQPKTDDESPIASTARILRPHLTAIVGKLGGDGGAS